MSAEGQGERGWLHMGPVYDSANEDSAVLRDIRAVLAGNGSDSNMLAAVRGEELFGGAYGQEATNAWAALTEAERAGWGVVEDHIGKVANGTL